MSDKEKTAFTVIDGGLKQEPGGDYIKEALGKGGHLSRVIDGYEPREGQIRMAQAIDNGIRRQVHIIAEGPTGTGKSLAYAVPASYHAAYRGLRVCIVTANKNLQRQIYDKDLELLSKAVPWKFTFAVRKGISSYLCERDLQKEKWRDFLLEGNLSEEEEQMVHETAEWAANTRTGDFEEKGNPGPSRKIWDQFSTSREECERRKCFAFEECHVANATAKANAAGIIVTNYHLLFTHLKLGPASKILPQFDVVILDEAHRAAKIARDFFGVEVTFGAIYRCVGKIHLVNLRGYPKKGEVIRNAVLAATRRLWTGLAARARARKSIIDERSPIESEELEGLLTEAKVFYAEVASKLDPGEPRPGSIQRADEAMRAQEADNCRAASKKCGGIVDDLFAFRSASEEGKVFFIEGSGLEEKNKWVRLKSKAIDVGGYMHHGLFKRYPTVVQTSATLAIRGSGSDSQFEYIRKEMGMGWIDNVSEIVVDSPFNWAKQGLLVIPKSMPQYVYGDASWDKEICKHIEKTVNIVGGRTMALFTSFRMMKMAAEHLRKKTNHTLYVQGEATNRELADRFQRETDSVLFGTESFSEGVSIEGSACTCVILDKIPFLHKNDPVMYGIDRDLRKKGITNRSSFDTYSLPEAIISFKQRAGRLIRTVNDVGVVVVLDKRLHTKGYRNQFIKSVSFDKVHDNLSAIKPFLKRVGAL